MAIHGDLLLEAWMDPGNPGNPGFRSLRNEHRIMRITENLNTSTMQSFKIFSRWRHILFSISQFNNPNPNPNPKPNPKPNPNPNPNPKPYPNGMFEIRQSFKHPF